MTTSASFRRRVPGAGYLETCVAGVARATSCPPRPCFFFAHALKDACLQGSCVRQLSRNDQYLHGNMAKSHSTIHHDSCAFASCLPATPKLLDALADDQRQKPSNITSPFMSSLEFSMDSAPLPTLRLRSSHRFTQPVD